MDWDNDAFASFDSTSSSVGVAFGGASSGFTINDKPFVRELYELR